MNEESLFDAAAALPPGRERNSLLDRECGDDQALRARLEQLLAAHDSGTGILDRGGAVERTVIHPPNSEAEATGPRVGMIVAGRFKLLEQIGEGGMGTVWVADQTAPIRRKVALKLIKAGMDSKSVIARFEAERQALALMDHPNIARVLDGGMTEQGRPYFVMEYVKGVPFTLYCDDARLTVEERLQLFVPVCQAVQHAHQKGIIHRDLKPTNILVCLYDGKPVPKVIDFGLAKAMHQSLTEHTVYTSHGMMLGTPLYMSPEQAELNNLDIDTRTDIYALGVVLYELMTGTTPLEKKQFQQAAWQEVVRLIKEVEPPRPSLRLSGSGALPSIAAQRRMEPVKLSRLLRGELDWVVLKALEKDRNRRYETASGFAADIQRYLVGEPVTAAPPSALYRLRKFAQRNRVMLSTVVVFGGLLFVATIISGWLAMKAMRAEELADERRIEAEANAKEAKEQSELYSKEAGAHFLARLDAEINARSLQIERDLAEVRDDRRVGLLRLARPHKQKLKGIEFKYISDDPVLQGFLDNADHSWDRDDGTFKALREFVTAAVLIMGQEFAPLLPPISHDGEFVLRSQLNSNGDRLLSLGADQSARLWDSSLGRQIAVLRQADEGVSDAGFSPDGAFAFTLASDGAIRLWEANDGRFRTTLDVRAAGRPSKVAGPSQAEPPFSSATRVELSSTRLVTWEDSSKNPDHSKSEIPPELWDAQSGRFVRRLEPPADHLGYEFFGGDRWICRREGHSLLVFGAEDGRHTAKLQVDDKYGSPTRAPITSPSLSIAATITETKDGEDPRGIGGGPYYIHRWDAKTWQILSTSGRIPWGALEDIDFWLLDDTHYGVENISGKTEIYQPASATPIAVLPGRLSRIHDRTCLLETGKLFDTKTWRQLNVPPGKRYHPDLVQFSPDGRFLPVVSFDFDCDFIDTVSEKSFAIPTPAIYANLGWVLSIMTNDEARVFRLPRPDKLDSIPPDHLELWAKVATCGELDSDGRFEPWGEATWEKHRQELAAKPAPIADFPFPGFAAIDKLHWRRAELDAANMNDKPRLAKQLLDRAKLAGDKAETTRWQRWLDANTNQDGAAKNGLEK